MPEDFSGKAFIVTGAASGMGRGIAEHLATLGARVGIIDVNAAGLEQTANAISERGGTVHAGAVSVADGAAVQRFVDDVLVAWGHIDGLVHAAAILRYGGVLQTKLDTWDEVLRVNLTGTFIINQAVARAMAEAGNGGAIVNIASVAATMGLANLAAYSAAKGGVAALSRTMAKEFLSYGIRVNFLNPGFVETGMTEDILANAATRAARAAATGVDRICQPADIAAACAFLLGEGGLFIAGHGLTIDSGVSLAGS
jgi:NAD(P)-dependent dehydrogenase (short-subunit alcohol dehydrogenase family)